MGLEMKINEINVKGIITKSNLPDADYVINPYIGCQHGCIYCYADFMRRFTGHAVDVWGQFVDVKVNAPDKINRSSKYENKKILIGSVTDAYQPVEGKYKLTRRILQKLIGQQPIIDILTKSGLVARDIDVLQQFDDATVGVSLSTLNRKISRELEPFAAPPKLRIDTLRKCKDAGLRTYLFVSPIFPFITELPEIIEQASPYADFFMFENLNIRPCNHNKIYEFLKKNRPGLIPKYNEIYGSKDKTYWNQLEDEIKHLCNQAGKEARIYFHHGGFKKK